MSGYVQDGYLSYSALARSPMLMGVPYMAFIAIGSGSILIGMLVANLVHPLGWLLALMSVPVLLYVREISITDDKAIDILILELKWYLASKAFGNTEFYGGAMMIAPTTYGRQRKHVKRFIEKTTRG
jgi:type IV secretion system protein VirB3